LGCPLFCPINLGIVDKFHIQAGNIGERKIEFELANTVLLLRGDKADSLGFEFPLRFGDIPGAKGDMVEPAPPLVEIFQNALMRDHEVQLGIAAALKKDVGDMVFFDRLASHLFEPKHQLELLDLGLIAGDYPDMMQAEIFSQGAHTLSLLPISVILIRPNSRAMIAFGYAVVNP
jgi:hypothetical protein